MALPYPAKSRTWDLGTAANGLFFDTEFDQLYANDDYIFNDWPAAELKTYLDTLYSPIAGETYITAQATPTRVTGAPPDAIGEYRSYLRAGSARTYSETNGSPTTAPDSTNGYLLYTQASWAGGSSNNQPEKYEIYIGTGKTPFFEFYTSTGRTGQIDITPFTDYGGTTYDGGIACGYDPTTGIAWVVKARQAGNSTAQGLDASTTIVTASNIYFDIKC